MTAQVIMLNGGSSSGKSGIARCLQAVLPDPWLAFRTDTLVEATPVSTRTSPTGIEFTADGEVIVGPEFRRLEAAWIAGIAAMARGPSGWPRPRPTWCIAVSSTTCRWTRHTPRRWNARGRSLPGCRPRRLPA